MRIALQSWVAWLGIAGPCAAATLTNGGFEEGLAGWRPLWTREAKAGTLTLDRQVVHAGNTAARIDHRGEKDWSFEPTLRVPVQAGDIFEIEAWLRLDARSATATICASLYNAAGRAVEWAHGARSLEATTDWQPVRTRFVVPGGIAEIQPRLIGHGPLTLWLDDYSIAKLSNLKALRPADLPPTLAVSNAALVVTLDTADATLSVLDRRSGERAEQRPVSRDFIVTAATAAHDRIQLTLLRADSGTEFKGDIRLERDRPEFTLELAGQDHLAAPLRFPFAFVSRAGQYLVVPMNEGISYPVDDHSIDTFRLIAFGGHGICMAFWGVTEGTRGHMAIIETADDAVIQIRRIDGRLTVAPEWERQRGQFGYPRRLRYVFFDQGGHVAMAKRYRAYAQQTGLLKTLAEKRQFNPDVDRLIGAVNVWCWDRDAVSLVKEMQAAGIDRILWSHRQTPENLRQLNDLGVLTSRYDIYQDVMDPGNFPLLRGVHPDWTTEAWPQDIITDAAGKWLRGWAVKGKDDQWFSCGVICDKRALDYARRRIPAELQAHPYRCRFIDTTTAAPWHECYHTNHPMTRTESRQSKMDLLRLVSQDYRLVTGCETGHDAAVPFLHYFEGMMSLGPYRVPDAGRDMARIWTNAPKRVVKFQLGHEYRLPLWELVYHDCVVAQWYWGDYNNKLPMLWDKRDLFNILYATPPMFMFNRRLWQENQTRFVQSYTNSCPTVRRVGYAEMTDHRFLTPDRAVQQTRFANGVTVTVNFSHTPCTLPGGRVLAGMGFSVD